ncbi:MAG: hypothetical protein ACWA41_01300 [Putridiphycobacter sp.]
MKNILFISLFTLLSFTSISQEFRVPKDYVLEEKEDFASYQDDFLKGVNWLFKHSVSDDEKKRHKIEKFVTEWIAGSPTVTVELNFDVAPFIRYSDFRVMYMGAWAKNAIEHDKYGDVLGNTLAGINAMMAYYKKFNGDLITIKSLEKYIKLERKDKLVPYIKKKLKYD